MKTIFFIAALAALPLASLAQKHVYILDERELDNYAEEAKERGKDFVIYYTGDTLRGNELKRKRGKWTLDGKEINLRKVRAFQDKDGYTTFNNINEDKTNSKYHGTLVDAVRIYGRDSIAGFTRLFRGKLSLYYFQADNSRLETFYNRNTGFEVNTIGRVTTSFYMGNEVVELITFNTLSEALKNCPTAIAQIEKEFSKTRWYRKRSEGINDYRALVRIFEVFNKCK